MVKKISSILSRKIRKLGADANITNKEFLYLNASRIVIKHYVGIDVSSPSRDSFFDNVRSDGTVSHIHMNRVTLLAESLFLIRDTSGFLEFCHRISERMVRSAFFEMLAAKQFCKAGFNLKARPEVGIKGEDFDFAAFRSDLEINVEVTALTAGTFSENTIYNALSHKRSQLPSDKPCVIYCVFPPSWIEEPDNWNNKPRLIAERFFRSTKRVNVVIFWAEKVGSLDNPDAGFLGMIRQPFLNDQARHKIENLEFLLSGTLASDVLSMATDPNQVDRALEYANSKDFYRWIDSLVPTVK